MCGHGMESPPRISRWLRIMEGIYYMIGPALPPGDEIAFGCTALPRTLLSVFSLGPNRTPGICVALIGGRSSEKCIGG